MLAALGLIGLVAVFGAHRRRRQRFAPLRAPIFGAACAVVPTLSFAYVAHRYLADFIPLGVLLAVVGFHTLVRWAGRQARSVRALMLAGFGLLTLLSIWFNVGLGVLYGRLIAPNNERDLASFVSFQYQLHEHFPGGALPRVTRATSLPPPEHRSVVVIGDCDALYRSVDNRWHAIERSERNGGFQLQVRFPTSPTGWELFFVNGRDPNAQHLAVRVLAGDRVQFAYRTVFAEPPVRIRPGHSYRVDVTLDSTPRSTTKGTLSVVLDGKVAWTSVLPNSVIAESLRPASDVSFGQGNAPGLPPRFTGTIRRVAVETPLCRRLAHDRDRR
jgi:hypothetical protein